MVFHEEAGCLRKGLIWSSQRTWNIIMKYRRTPVPKYMGDGLDCINWKGRKEWTVKVSVDWSHEDTENDVEQY